MILRNRPDDLVVEDDPAFTPGVWNLPPLEFDLPHFEHGPVLSSQLTPLSSKQHSRSASQSSLPNLNILSSSHGSVYQLPPDPFQLSSAGKLPQYGRIYEDEPLLFDDNLDFEIGPDGEVRDRDISSIPGPRFGSDSAASGRVRRDHEEALLERLDVGMVDDFIAYNDNQDPALPSAEAFQSRKRSMDESSRFEGETEIESAEAPLKRRKTRKTKKMKMLLVDRETQIPKIELRDFQTNYLENMRRERAVKERKVETAKAKVSANRLVWGLGIGGVGQGHGQRGILGELADMYAGDALRLMICGSIPQKGKRSRSLAADVSTGKHQEHQNKNEEEEVLSANAQAEEDKVQVGRFDDDEGFRQDYGDDVEIGRVAEIELEQRRSSIMPWNTSASLRSHRTGSIAGARHSSIIPGRQSRLTSASPLIGRGRIDPSAVHLEDFERLDELGDPGILDFSSNPPLGGFMARVKTSSQQAADEDFEYFGVAADVDTQTAGNSQWVAEALAKESRNFLEYVVNTIDEEKGDDLDPDVPDDRPRCVAFSQLIPERSSSIIVASQAFYHVLTLATAGKLSVKQERPFDEIFLMLRSVAV